MANRVRVRSGQVQLCKVRVLAATVIEAGDLVYLDGNTVKPASAFAWNTNLGTTQTSFADVFLGVSHQPSAEGETSDLSIDLSPLAVYEFDVAAGAYEVGDDLGPDENSSALMSQQLEGVTTGTRAIARAVEYRTAANTLRVCLASAFFAGSGNRAGEVG